MRVLLGLSAPPCFGTAAALAPVGLGAAGLGGATNLVGTAGLLTAATLAPFELGAIGTGFANGVTSVIASLAAGRGGIPLLRKSPLTSEGRVREKRYC